MNMEITYQSTLRVFYSIDGTCDDELVDCYERFGFLKGNGMMIRNYEHQAAQ